MQYFSSHAVQNLFKKNTIKNIFWKKSMNRMSLIHSSRNLTVTFLDISGMADYGDVSVPFHWTWVVRDFLDYKLISYCTIVRRSWIVPICAKNNPFSNEYPLRVLYEVLVKMTRLKIMCYLPRSTNPRMGSHRIR